MKISEIKQRLDYIYYDLCAKSHWCYCPLNPKASVEAYLDRVEDAIESVPVGN